MRKINKIAATLIFSLGIIGPAPPAFTQAMVIDHTCTNLSQIPDSWIIQAKSDLHIAYQHTSHGSQLITGMNSLENFAAFGTKYEWSDNGSSGLDLDDYGISGCADLSQGDYIDGNGVTPWVTATRNLLDNAANYHVNVIVWSWCSINIHNAQRYVDNMEILISEYSEGGTASRAALYPVKFVFMTGHAQGQGENFYTDPDANGDGHVHYNNQLIRQHCSTFNRILFDFADIEAYDPDGNYYWDLNMTDELYYTGGNWGEEWIDANPGSELELLTTGCSSCAHCNGPGNKARINCVLKGRAAWWLWAQLAGWNGQTGEIPPTPTPFPQAATPIKTPTILPPSPTPSPTVFSTIIPPTPTPTSSHTPAPTASGTPSVPLTPTPRPISSWPAGPGTEIGGNLPVGYEPSGIVRHERYHDLFLVSDNGWVSRMDQSGTVSNTWTPGGDLEGIAVANSDTDYLYLGVENPDAIQEFDISNGALTGKSWELTSWMTGPPNQGLESLTFIPDGHHPYSDGTSGGLFYAGLQADGQIYIFDIDLSASGTVTHIDTIEPYPGVSDLSGLHYHAETYILYAVFDSSNYLMELETDGTLINIYDLAGDNQEGITLANSCPASETEIFIAEDSGEVWLYDKYPVICSMTSTPSPSPTVSPPTPPTPPPTPPPSPTSEYTSTPPPTPSPTATTCPCITPTPISTVSFSAIHSVDFNGDGTDDIGVFRPASGLWAIRGVTRFYFGTTGDYPVCGDYYGDGTARIGVFRDIQGLWAIRRITRFYYGATEDLPVVADYDGDGLCDIGVFRPSIGLWAIPEVTRFYFGSDGDHPQPGDYTGDGTAEGGIYRESDGLWALRDSSRIYFGGAGDNPVRGDFNGDGTVDIGIFRGSNGLWAARMVTRTYFGTGGDNPVPAYFDGNRVADIAVFRESSGLWAIQGFSRIYFGKGDDIPLSR